MFTSRRQRWLMLCLWCGLVSLMVRADDPSPNSTEIQRRIREDQAEVPWTQLRFGLAAEQKVLDALQAKLVVSWRKKPLSEVLASLKQATSIPIEIDEESWMNEGMDLEPEVSLELGESTALFAIHQLRSQLNVTWSVEYGAIRLMPWTKAEERLTTRVYDVSKLTKWLAQNGLDKLTDEEVDAEAGVGGGGGTFGGGGGFFQIGGGGEVGGGPKPPSETPVTIRRRVNRELLAERLLANFVVSMTSGKWEAQDGEGGTINYWSQRLVVRQSFHVHLEVAGCLRSLERLMLGEGNPSTTTFPGLADPVEEQAALETALRKRITLKADNIPLRTVITGLAKQHGLRLRFASDQPIDDRLDAAPPVTRNVADVSLRLALQLVLEPESLVAFDDDGVLTIMEAGGCGDLQRTIAYRMDKIPHAANRQALVELIQEQTSSKWELVDAEGGSLWWMGPKILLVQCEPRVHDEVASLLRELQGDVVEGKLVFEAVGGTPNRDWELKLYKFDSADEAKDVQEALPFVLRDPAQVTKSRKIGVQLAIEATPPGHAEIEKFLKLYRGVAKPPKQPATGTTVGTVPDAGVKAGPIEAMAGSTP